MLSPSQSNDTKVLDGIAIALRSARLVQLDDGRVSIIARYLAFGA